MERWWQTVKARVQRQRYVVGGIAVGVVALQYGDYMRLAALVCVLTAAWVCRPYAHKS